MKDLFGSERSPVFWGTVAIVLMAQVRGATSQLSLEAGLPISLDKAITVVTVVLAVVLARRAKPSANPLYQDPGAQLGLLYLVAATLSYLLAAKAPLGIEALESTFGALLYFALVLSVSDSPRRIETLLMAILVGASLSAAVVLYDIGTGSRLFTDGDVTRSGGAFGDATTSSAMILTGVMLGVVLTIYPNRFRTLAAVTALVGTAALIASFARSAALGYVLVAIFILYGLRGHRYFPAILMAGLVCLVAVALAIPDKNWESLGALLNFDKDPTLWRRVSYHVIGLDLLTQHPLFGIGPKNYPAYYFSPEYRWVTGRTFDARAMHNMYLEVAVQYGLVGLVPFLGLVFYAFRQVLRGVREGADPGFRVLALAIFYSAVALFVICATLPSLSIRNVWILLALMMAIGRLVPRRAAASARSLQVKSSARPAE